jgi:hypothetical protein
MVGEFPNQIAEKSPAFLKRRITLAGLKCWTIGG